MTATNGSQAGASGHLGTDDPNAELCEELCDMQADLLGMGEDNYRRLRRVCPDANLRLHALLHRVANNRNPPCRSAVRLHGQRAVGHRSGAFLPGGRLRFPVDNGPGWRELIHQRSDPDRALWAESPRDPDPADSFATGPHRDADRCWRCDARSAAADIGLCRPCHGSLVSR